MPYHFLFVVGGFFRSSKRFVATERFSLTSDEVNTNGGDKNGNALVVHHSMNDRNMHDHMLTVWW